MAASGTSKRTSGGLLGLIARLRAAGGQKWGDIVVTAVVAIAAAGAALALNDTTPIRFVENLTRDLRIADGALAA